MGASAGSNLITGDNNIDIGNAGVGNEADTIRIGTSGTQDATFIAGIFGVAVNVSPVVVNSNGRLGVTASSARFKDEIRPMNTASEAIYDLRPVTFHYKPQLDATAVRQFGLVAEDVSAVNPDLVMRDKDGKPYTVRYDAINAMLLNEFLKEHRKNEKQEASIAGLRQEIAALTAGLQKVSAQLELSKAAPQTVVNNH